jgi:Glyoxalase/Bleomycin resistance protein/Dioxygenase superfamily
VNSSDHFHVGVVVDDLESTLADLTELFGHRWGETFSAPVQVRVPSGEQEIPLCFSYSMTEPRVEVIRTIPGTLWTPAAGSGIHHLGYWSDDVPGDSERLSARGYEEEAAGVTPDGTAYWAYHRHRQGPRIEIVSRQVQPMLQKYWDTGTF